MKIYVFFLPTNIHRTLLNKDLLIIVPGSGLQLLLVFIMKSAKNVIKKYVVHRRMQNTRIIHDVWRLLILSNEEKTNDYENFEKGMIYMKILKKGG
jgi:hypothetical protein